MQTWLFAPGHEERKVRKALASAADFVVLDWEDAVPSAAKAEARAVTGRIADELETLERLAIRVSNPETEFFMHDVAGLALRPVAVIVVPKVESVAQVEAAARLERPLMLILESALGIERAFELATCHESVRYLALGPLDLLADLGGTWTPEGEETLYARARVAIAARAAGLVAAIDGPYPRLRELEALEADSARARRMGYGGRLLIHPEQIDPVERAYTPTAQDLEFARKVLEAVTEVDAAGRGALLVEGRFVDPPVIKWARKVLARVG
jgi:citrate lyase subunit beta/citryl-CoA lyase